MFNRVDLGRQQRLAKRPAMIRAKRAFRVRQVAVPVIEVEPEPVVVPEKKRSHHKVKKTADADRFWASLEDIPKPEKKKAKRAKAAPVAESEKKTGRKRKA